MSVENLFNKGFHDGGGSGVVVEGALHMDYHSV